MTTRQRDGHVHRWRIAEPNGQPHVEGRCAGCGAVRSFPASAAAYWERLGLTERKAAAFRAARRLAQRAAGVE